MNPSTRQALEDAASDEQLMLAAGTGDLGAFEQLVRRYQQPAWNAAYRFLGDASEAEDIAQEAFARILAAARRYQASAHFRTYLYRIVTRICLDHSAKKKPIYSERLPDRPDPAYPSSNGMAVREREQAVRAALDRLPANQRMAVVLKYFDGLRYSEIAEAMETSTKAVERLLARARDTLLSSLAPLQDL
jgi:RNA polymerase sigma-70 factor (ECF subfamily)